VAKLFEKQRTDFYYNWLSFIEDFLRSLWVWFFMGHSEWTCVHKSRRGTVKAPWFS